MTNADSKHVFEHAVARYNQVLTNGLTPIDPEEMGLGSNFSSIWNNHPESRP